MGTSGPPTGGDATQTVAPPDADHSLVRQLRLRVVEGPGAGQSYSARARTTVVGKHETADFVIDDPTLSRFHCELEVREDHVVVRDLDSRNGTRIGTTALVEARVKHGTILTLGTTQLRLEFGLDQVRVPLSKADRFGSLVGVSAEMRAVFAMLEAAAGSDATLLLSGETGTGKDLAAESVHLTGPRADEPFVVVDCGAIPGDLLESKLFGHEKGAFTGADRDRVGAMEEAHGGTLFLDEIGELALELQPKLLRALESREIQRVGSNARVPVDVRVIAATNRNLRQEVNERRFRSDLYYRIAVAHVHMPPLRARKQDLPVLVESIVEALTGLDDATKVRLREPGFVSELAKHDWPGNVRELRNYLERAALFGTAPALDEQPTAAPTIDTRQSIGLARERWVLAFEREYLQRLLEETNHNISAAARRAGVNRVHFYRLLSRCGLR